MNEEADLRTGGISPCPYPNPQRRRRPTPSEELAPYLVRGDQESPLPEGEGVHIIPLPAHSSGEGRNPSPPMAGLYMPPNVLQNAVTSGALGKG